ncbi:MAG: ATPase [Gammaproteobacteria bacterium]|nr:ATPase [Gammaproteobacteria bacterium]
MIIRMSKVQVAGPRSLLMPVLETIQRTEALQIDPQIKGRIDEGAVLEVRPLALDGRTLAERLFLEDLGVRIERLLALLPGGGARESYLSQSRALNSIAALVGKHLAAAEQRVRRRSDLQSELAQLNRYRVFLSTVESLVPRGAEAAGLEYIGVEVRDPTALEQLTRVAGSLLLGAEVRTARAEDGSYIGLLTTEKELASKLKEGLHGNQIPEIVLPSYLEGLPLRDKLEAARARHEALSAEAAKIDAEARDFAVAWRGHYEAMLAWLRQRLSLLRTSAEVYETDRCFVMFGWMPSAGVDRFRQSLAEHHGDAVVVEEKEILQKELEDVPVSLRNPGYFRPFELLVRLLPTPRYTSIDPTPFIGIFFPLFFGMILGDVGYGILLAFVAAGLVAFAKGRNIRRQVGQILFAASIYTIIFGVLYGELFGEAGARLIGIEEPLIDRRKSIMPMLYFTMAVGTVHVLVGLALGFLSALRGHRRNEAIFKLFSILILLCIAGVAASYYAPVGALVRKPLLMAMLVIAPVLLLTGGFLAPFELLRHLGNIVSYVRIMAVGLASVLLAYVANSLAGRAGSVWIGVAVAILLHTFNLLLGVFAPTVHALRLHYVEFFSKFVEPGGKPYVPLKKVD